MNVVILDQKVAVFAAARQPCARVRNKAAAGAPRRLQCAGYSPQISFITRSQLPRITFSTASSP